jgi:serine/threonine protein kinase
VVVPAQEPPRQVPGWRLEGELGGGAFARVFRARRDRDGQWAALKVATPGDRLARLQLAAEARALRLVGPPAVPELLGEGAFDDGTPWLLLELVEWPTLEALLGAEPAPLEGLAALGLSLLSAVERLHAAGVLHLDLKPANVFARLQPAEVRLLDLGLSRAPGGGAAALELEAAGTPAYLAPEQCDGQPLTARTDLYSLGVLLFELLAGAPPFSGTAGLVFFEASLARPPCGSSPFVPR